MKTSMWAIVEDILLAIAAIAALPIAAFVAVSVGVGRVVGNLFPSFSLGIVAAIAVFASTLNALFKQRGLVYRIVNLITRFMLWASNDDNPRDMWRSAIYGAGGVVVFALAIIIPNNL